MGSKVAINTQNRLALSVSLLGNRLAIKQMLQQQLKMVIVFSGIEVVDLTPEKISLHRLSDDLGVFYRCAIALKLASVCKKPAFEIADQLVASLTKINLDNSPVTSCLDFQVELVPPGWLNLRLSNQGLAIWLEYLSQKPSHNPPESSLCPQNPQNLFPVQYAHARCCSLLRSAHQQNLIQLKNLECNTHPWQFLEPNPIPWLNDDRETLRLVHQSEKLLLEQILDLSDALFSHSPMNYLKLAFGLSQAFDKFYANCRIWGDVNTQTPQLAQTRLGLVALTQGLLRSLLCHQLHSFAPLEL